MFFSPYPLKKPLKMNILYVNFINFIEFVSFQHRISALGISFFTNRIKMIELTLSLDSVFLFSKEISNDANLFRLQVIYKTENRNRDVFRLIDQKYKELMLKMRQHLSFLFENQKVLQNQYPMLQHSWKVT